MKAYGEDTSLPSELRDFCELPDATDSNSVAKTYTWGLDLSGDLKGAGGECNKLGRA